MLLAKCELSMDIFGGAMHFFERWCVQCRHSKILEGAKWLRDFLRPCYDLILALIAPRGVERTMNGMDSIRLHPRCRGILETYEPEVWNRLMREVREGDIVADVGASVGLYTIALAQRVGDAGRVIAFEPDSASVVLLKKNLALNAAGRRVEIVEAAVGNEEGSSHFEMGLGSQSHVGTSPSRAAPLVRSVTLDRTFERKPLNLLKIDVEGFEERVLAGASLLLKDRSHKPRAIFIEVHPYAWDSLGTTVESLLGLLTKFNYRILDVHGQPVAQINGWGEIVAYRGE